MQRKQPFEQKYKLSKSGFLGNGVFGQVYEASRVNEDDYKYAVKIVRDLRENELINWQLIKGKYVTELIDWYEDSTGSTYCVMEKANQGNLKQYLEKKRANNQLSVSEILLLFHKIVIGYEESIYKQRIIHRDLKPENILIHNDDPKITDFGWTRQMSAEESLINASGFGTPKFSPPESQVYPILFSLKFDVYSLGAILYFCFYGDTPSEPRTMMDLIQFYQRLEESQNQAIEFKKLKNFKDATQLDIYTQGLILKMMEHNQDRRPEISFVRNHPVFNRVQIQQPPMGLNSIYQLSQFCCVLPETVPKLCSLAVPQNRQYIEKYYIFNLEFSIIGIKAIGQFQTVLIRSNKIVFLSVMLFKESLTYLSTSLRVTSQHIPTSLQNLQNAFKTYKGSTEGISMKQQIDTILEQVTSLIDRIKEELAHCGTEGNNILSIMQSQMSQTGSPAEFYMNELILAVQDEGQRNRDLWRKDMQNNQQAFFLFFNSINRKEILSMFNSFEISNIYTPENSFANQFNQAMFGLVIG